MRSPGRCGLMHEHKLRNSYYINVFFKELFFEYGEISIA